MKVDMKGIKVPTDDPDCENAWREYFSLMYPGGRTFEMIPEVAKVKAAFMSGWHLHVIAMRAD